MFDLTLKTAKVKGRIEMVKVSEDFTLMIDYAHNAMSLESLLSTLKDYQTLLHNNAIYHELQEVVKQYATTKGEYAERMQSLRDMYTGVYEGTDFDAKLQKELTADIVGEYLFTDTEFINKLSTEKPTLFKKIFDEIKYLCKIFTI